MSEDFYETRWMFRMLDYETWRVFHLGQEIGLLTTNTVDRSVQFQLLEGIERRAAEGIPGGFMAAYRWARQHEVAY